MGKKKPIARVMALNYTYNWRVYGGRRYFEVDRKFKSKTDAKTVARALRNVGRRARVMKVGKNWKVFAHKRVVV